MIHPFGKDFTRYFYPLVDDAAPVTILSSQTPAIYFFDTQPSRTAASAGTGAVQTVAAWTWNAGSSGWSYTVTAINDPDPTSTLTVRTYWEAINFRLQSAGQIQTVVRAFDLQRVSGHAVSVGVNDEMLREYFPQLDSCSTEVQRAAYVTLAVEDVKSRLKSKGYDWAKVTRPDRLTIAIAYKVLYMIMLVQLQQGNDKYAVKYAEFKKIYESMIEGLTLEYDANEDGLPDTEVKASSDFIRLVR